ncbi:hypothetical protein [Pelagibius sp.]|uniref:hypothetical protein n=1 Tax=Pelagibius sp. TaxID=1931238 RepID=UPI0026089634|nr:hypothetical protein [Pelagibius sp.]
MDEFLTPELIGGLTGGLIVAIGLFIFRGVAWIKDFVTGTPTKLDDKVYNKVVEAFREAGEISLPESIDQGKGVRIDNLVLAKRDSGNKDSSPRSPAMVAAAALLMALTLTACDPFKAFIPSGSVIQSGEAAEDESAQKRLADQIFGAVSGQEGRTARLTLVMATYSELAADRVTRFDQDQAPTVLGRFAELRGMLARFQTTPDAVFVETNLRYASLAIASIVIDTGLDRAGALAGNVIGGLSVSGLGDRAKVVARQAALTEALLADVRAATARMRDDPSSIAGIQQAALARFTANENRIKAILGLIA